jgi:hypothetical protein
MDLPDQIRSAQVQDLAAIFLSAPIALQIEGKCLQSGPHRPVEHDDALSRQIQKWLPIHRKPLPRQALSQ